MWQRVFDFNNSTTTGYMYLTTYQNFSSPSSLKFAISMTGNTAEQTIRGNRSVYWGLAPRCGHARHRHALHGDPVRRRGRRRDEYVDDLAAFSAGDTANNWIGRSPFTDPMFDGLVDDFRVYDRELSLGEVATLATSH